MNGIVKWASQWAKNFRVESSHALSRYVRGYMEH
jgi:hypothetical protein